MFKVIEHPADCEIRSVISFLNARNINIHPQLCQVYGEDAISDGMVRRWVRKFNEGRVSVHDEQRTGRPSLINDDLVRAVDEKIRVDRRFTIFSLSLNFPQLSRSALYKIVTDRLLYRKLCSRWVPKMLTEEHKTERASSALCFLTRYSEQGDEFLDHIVTGVSHDTCIEATVYRTEAHCTGAYLQEWTNGTGPPPGTKINK